MWLRHWGLASDPFAGLGSPYVSLPSHDEALCRLVDSIERAEPLVTFFAQAGLGKTTVVRRAIAEIRNPRRRFALVQTPSDTSTLVGLLAERLGGGIATGLDLRAGWYSLNRAVRASALEGSQMVFVIDGWDETSDYAIIRDLGALASPGRAIVGPVTIVVAGQAAGGLIADAGDSWTLGINLARLTRSETECYLDAKLAAAGCSDRIFTPRALTRVHLWSGGVPRGLERIATTCLTAGAAQGLEVISPDLVDCVAEQCRDSVTLAHAMR